MEINTTGHAYVDLGIDDHKPANIVTKMSRCRYSERDFWENVIKISDDIGKHMGDPELLSIILHRQN